MGANNVSVVDSMEVRAKKSSELNLKKASIFNEEGEGMIFK